MEFELIPSWFFITAFFIFGSIIGSFLNVCIYRLPREESIVFPVSHCPTCSNPIAWYDNVPILSFIILRAKCRRCHNPISFQYPFVESLNGLAYACVFIYFGISWLTLLYMIFISAMIVVTFIDYYHQIIPDEISLGGIPIGFLASFWLLPITWKQSLLGILIGSGILLVFSLFWLLVFHIEGMGMGDVKLMAAVGSFLGWKLALLTIILGSLLGSIVGVVLMAFYGKNFKTKIPFGSFLAPTAILSIFLGNHLINWYVGLLYK